MQGEFLQSRQDRALYRSDNGAGRYWWTALALSVAAHAVALFGVPQMDFSWLRAPGADARPIEARIVQVAPVVDTPAPPPPRAAAPKPRPRPPAKPRPVVPRAPVLPAVAEVPSASIEPPAPPPHAVNEQLRDRDHPEVVADAAESPAALPASSPAADESAKPEAVAAEPAGPRKETPPAPFTEPVKYPIRRAALVYDLRYGATPVRIGTVRHTFEVEGGKYRAETIAEASGIFAVLYGGQYVQRSTGHLGTEGLVPEEYFVMRGKPDRAERATFDWDAKRVSFTRRNETDTKPLTSGVQDPVSMLHQLYFYQPLPQTAFLDIATSRKVNTYTYELVGEELLETPLGIVQTVHLKREDEDSDRLELWLDPRRAYLPIKLYYVDRKGTVFDQVVREISVEATSTP